MPAGPLDPKRLAFYMSLSQIGLEMVGPLVVGLILDDQFGWSPWGAVIGAVIGPVAGLGHLVLLLNRPPSDPRDIP